MATSRVVPLTGAAGLRTMGEEDLLAYLCMHGALHWWNRLKWLADVNALLAQTPDIERLVHAAEARGAGRAGVSQPAVSATVAKLEEEMGQKLLERRQGSAVPTAAGSRFLAAARNILIACSAIKSDIRATATPQSRNNAGMTIIQWRGSLIARTKKETAIEDAIALPATNAAGSRHRPKAARPKAPQPATFAISPPRHGMLRVSPAHLTVSPIAT